jgi:hypothetical protein
MAEAQWSTPSAIGRGLIEEGLRARGRPVEKHKRGHPAQMPSEDAAL